MVATGRKATAGVAEVTGKRDGKAVDATNFEDGVALADTIATGAAEVIVAEAIDAAETGEEAVVKGGSTAGTTTGARGPNHRPRESSRNWSRAIRRSEDW